MSHVLARPASPDRTAAPVNFRISSTGVASATAAEVLRTPEARRQLEAVSRLRTATERNTRK